MVSPFPEFIHVLAERKEGGGDSADKGGGISLSFLDLLPRLGTSRTSVRVGAGPDQPLLHCWGVGGGSLGNRSSRLPPL